MMHTLIDSGSGFSFGGRLLASRTALLACAMILIVGSASAENYLTGVPHPSGTMAFTSAYRGGNCSDCAWIAAEGPITERTPQDFENFIRARGRSGTIVLDSNGGNLIAGLRLGEAIRFHKMSTTVGRSVAFDANVQQVVQGHCYSACAYAFLGGVRRAAKTGELGFHQFRTPITNAANSGADEASAQRAMGLLVSYLRQMSIEPTLLTHAAAADPTTLFRPDADIMFKLSVTNVRGTQVFSGWSIQPYMSGAIVTGKLPATGVTENDQQEDQVISFYCRTDSPGKVLVSAAWEYDNPSPKDAATDNDNLRSYVDGSSITIGGKIVRKSEGYDSIVDAHVDSADRWFLTYALTSDELDAAIRTGDLHIEISGPHFLGDFGFSFGPPISGLADAVLVAFKSCL